MLLITNICLLIVFLVIVYQDFKEYSISWFVIPLVFGLFLVKGIYLLGIKESLRSIVFNLAFITIQLGGLIIYYSLKKKKVINVLKEKIGIGDILLFVSFCAGFSTINFVLFFLAALLFSLVFFGLYNFLSSSKKKYIPLAGTFALFYTLLMINSYIFNLNFYNDQLIEGWITNLM